MWLIQKVELREPLRLVHADGAVRLQGAADELLEQRLRLHRLRQPPGVRLVADALLKSGARQLDALA